TFDFQARAFYERLGYSVYGALDNFPRGHTQFHLAKVLVSAL
ncbi:MAG: N-acetyltransferase, partial [Phycisphaerae bacterium]|nr:N-acetyltransferase [Gemmatimonadaceae bacterium]